MNYQTLRIRIVIFLGAVFIFLGFFSAARAQENENGDARSRRNPFIPLVSADGRLINLEKGESKAELLVEGTVFDKYGRSYAIVNGLVVEVGDTIVGYRVIKIQQDKVTFMKDGQTRAVEITKKEEEK